MKRLFLGLIVIILVSAIEAQTITISPDSLRTDWWGDIDGFLNHQAGLSLKMADKVIKTSPPSVDEPEIRKMALLLIDNVLHDEKAALRPAVQSFFRNRIETAIDEITTIKVEKGIIIWKLYNHTFVIKTPDVTIAFDLQKGTPGVEGMQINDDLLLKLIRATDILFITHTHNDHASEWVAETFLSQGKPVISPPDIWKDKPIYSMITHPVRKADFINEVLLPAKSFKLRFVVNPGHQGENLLNNVYLVITPGGISVAHSGDQSNKDDFGWIDHVGDNFKVDVLMVNSWSVYPEFRLARGFRPKLIFAGHENELAHTIDHREPYWLNPVRLGNKDVFPWIEMVWGEKFNYIPADLK
jgi:L-ascorbate metabolism protein UlaG (beta-lactamase superfamily)